MPAKRASIKSDLKRIDAMKDADIDYSDIPEISDEDFARAVVKEPVKATITMRLDQDVLDWFKDQGTGYQTHMNSVLRRYRDLVVTTMPRPQKSVKRTNLKS
jgi:uncharacterized protein (DUF4415 family)